MANCFKLNLFDKKQKKFRKREKTFPRSNRKQNKQLLANALIKSLIAWPC